MAGKRKGYEGSKADLAEDKRGAKRKGMSLKDYETSAQDKAEDRKGQAKLGRKK
jgi:hypothetical protein